MYNGGGEGSKNSTVTDQIDGKRVAIIVGIDNYQESNDIQPLAGAENDARELYDRLTNRGGFEVLERHYLLGKDATHRAILKAISDIFRKSQVNYNLIVFYFSGHGTIDENNDGYIVPYDMSSQDPFVGGINMEDLRKTIYRSKKDSSVVVILDCCYAGIAAKSMKAIPDSQTRNIYAGQVLKFTESPDKNVFSRSGEGKIILASSEATTLSRERNNCSHEDESIPPHTHGAFTYHLIDGIDGKAADPETGIVTFGSLKGYIENQMLADGKQRPIYQVEEGSLGIESIRIAVSVARLENKAQELINQVEDYCKNTDIQSLTLAAKTLHELELLDPRNKDLKSLQEGVDNALSKYKDPLKDWLNYNTTTSVRLKIEQSHAGLYDTFYDLLDGLSYSDLQKIDRTHLHYLITLCGEAIRHANQSLEDKEINRLLMKLDMRPPQPKHSLQG